MKLAEIVGSDEFKLFITFLLVFSFFSHWAGWNETSRLALTRSIAEEGNMDIDEHANLTGDRSFYKGHYYSDKAPGTSFLMTPIYFSLDNFFDVNGSQAEEPTVYVRSQEYNATVFSPVNPSSKIFWTRLLSIFLLSSIPGALLIVLIYKITCFFVDEDKALITSVALGLGTIIFAYSTVLMGIITATFLSFLSFYLILKIQRDELNQRYYILSGVFAGFSIVTSYLMVILSFAFFAYLFWTEDSEKYVKFFLGLVIGVTPLLIYNFAIFQNPFELTFFHIDKDIFPLPLCFTNSAPEFCKNLQIDRINHFGRFIHVLPRILFFPSRGLFFYSPLLLISLPGLYLLLKKDRGMFLLSFFIILGFLIFNSIYFSWFAGTSFGPRYLTPAIPFFSIPFALSLKWMDKKSIFKIISVFVVFISIFHSFLAFSSWQGLEISEGYFEKLYSFQSFGNPLYNQYLPKFLDHGPRSPLLSSILKGNFQMTYELGYTDQATLGGIPGGILNVKISYLLALILFLIFISGFWSKVKELIPCGGEMKKAIIYSLVFVIALTILLAGCSLEKISFGNRWKNRNGLKVMRGEGKIYFYSFLPGEKYKIKFHTKSLHEDKKAVLSFNDKELGGFYSFIQGNAIYTPLLDMKKGLNTLKIDTKGKDPKVIEEGERFELGIKKLKLIPYQSVENESWNYIFAKNWYKEPKGKNTRWMKNNGSLHLFNFQSENRKIKLKLSCESFPENRHIKVIKDNEKVGEFTTYPEGSLVYTRMINLTPGETSLSFRDGKCSIISKNDTRCVSFGISDIDLVDWKYIRNESWNYIFAKNWYKKAENEEVRWSPNNGTLFLYNFEKNPRELTLNLGMKSYHEARLLNFSLDGRFIGKRKLTSKISTQSFDITLKPGENILRIYSQPACKEAEYFNDTRCLAFAIRKIYLTR